MNFVNVLQAARIKLPFGIAQIGKSFRNEITPGNFIFRMREFEQMEIEFFVEPGTDEEWLQYWIDERWTGTSTSASAPRTCACSSTPGEALALLEAHRRHRVPLPFAAASGASSRASPTAPTSTSRPTASLRRGPVVLRPGENERKFPYVIEPPPA